MGTAIVVTSGKGGTGKTSITGGVAGSLAGLGHSVLCIDMDIGLRNLDISLGLSDRALMDFSDVAEGRCPLVRAAVNHPDLPGLALLTAPMTLSPALTEEDRRNLDWAARCGVTDVLQPFVRGAEDLAVLRGALAERGLERVRVMAKIENQLGIEKLDEIIDASDVICIARGDLAGYSSI